MKICISCGEQTKKYTQFTCPKCDDEIVRCQHCKEMAIKWRSPTCGTRGP